MTCTVTTPTVNLGRCADCGSVVAITGTDSLHLDDMCGACIGGDPTTCGEPHGQHLMLDAGRWVPCTTATPAGCDFCPATLDATAGQCMACCDTSCCGCCTSY